MTPEPSTSEPEAKPDIPAVSDAPPADVIKSKEPDPADIPDPVDPPREVKEGETKAVNAWTHLKRENRELKEKLEAASKATPVEEADMVALREQLEEAEERLGQLDVTQTQEFKMQYVAPIETAFVKGVDMLQQAGKSEQDAVAIMRELVDRNNSLEDHL